METAACYVQLGPRGIFAATFLEHGEAISRSTVQDAKGNRFSATIDYLTRQDLG